MTDAASRHSQGTANILSFHGMTSLDEYKIWSQMKQRCANSRVKTFKYYGGRGITMCPEWLDSFKAFYQHIGPRPSPEHSIDRIDNDGNYEPGNVRWATKSEQAKNRLRQRRPKLKSDLKTLDAHVVKPSEYADAPELTDEQLAAADVHEAGKLVRRGRPPSANRKVPVKLRLDPDLVKTLRASGPGWQTLINQVLRDVVLRKAGPATAVKAIRARKKLAEHQPAKRKRA